MQIAPPPHNMKEIIQTNYSEWETVLAANLLNRNHLPYISIQLCMLIMYVRRNHSQFVSRLLGMNDHQKPHQCFSHLHTFRQALKNRYGRQSVHNTEEAMKTKL